MREPHLLPDRKLAFVASKWNETRIEKFPNFVAFWLFDFSGNKHDKVVLSDIDHESICFHNRLYFNVNTKENVYMHLVRYTLYIVMVQSCFNFFLISDIKL